MGVPKFFRWMSERYPAISQLIAENRIPEFDNLYLDMNGIIHNCTHKDSDSPTFRMTEDKMFIAIFNYIEHLYGKIKPQKLFFMAIDGVAPRAKMNQQRARRFRTALDAEKAKEKALRDGVEMPTEEAFDSNCITPGTEFMAKLTRQLKYFISKKISEDVEWQGVEIVLSGHEVPGEGEHKIMEYIRMAKAQPDYDANIRHCLYGLDADLIMLGLLSHDPHFALLREEVTFGRQAKKTKELEHQNFYLMHLCIVREYLELEFQELKLPGALSFPFDLERVIDDFILMAFFVGNDFLPNLPNLHINEGALALMFKIYKSVLPKAGGFINERGVINLKRLAILLGELQDVEYRFFESENADASWFKGKQMGKVDVMDKEVRETRNKKGPLSISSSQKDVFKLVKQYVNKRSGDSQSPKASLDLPSTLNANDRKFVENLAEDLHLQWKSIADDQDDRHLRLDFPEKSKDDQDDEDIEDEEASLALLRVIKRYENAKIVDVTPEEAQEQLDQKYEEKFRGWKDKYYKGKFGWGLENSEGMRKLAENYVQGLQWVLYYYYRGVASWPWYYGYHYSPMISDVTKGINADMSFPLGQPFRPYQQLMGVLPDRSKTIVPTPYHDLMTNPDSPIIDFYPRDFELDMNGKKMEWEAVVKIPFIDEKRLLPAMKTKEHLLSQDERDRNEFGVSLKFTYSPEIEYIYPSSLVGVFPDIPRCHCVENIFDLPTMDGIDEYHIGLMPGAKLGEAALAGFPSLKTIPFNGSLGFHSVNVFQQDSRNESMVITLLDPESRTKIEMVKGLLGRQVHVNYPFLSEGKVVRVSDEMFSYTLPSDGVGTPMIVPHGPPEIGMWHKKAQRIESTYSKRLGMIIGEVQALVHVDILKGLTKTDNGATIKKFEAIPGIETDYASQMIVEHVISEDQRFLEKVALPVAEEFPLGLKAFFLGDFSYGRVLQVVGHSKDTVEIKVSTSSAKTQEFGRQIVAYASRSTPYSPSYAVAKLLGLNPLVLSKLTSSFQVNLGDQRINLGLNLKFEAKKMKVLGYSKRGATGWEFSEKAIQLIRLYMMKFPIFIAGIQRNSQGSMYDATDFYPEDEAKAKIKEIQAWLKEQESKNFEPVPLDAEQLDSDVVAKIEEAAARALQIENSAGAVKKINGAPRNAILKPADAEQRLSNQQFSLGDRIVYVQDSGKVPIATRGTVVGKSRTARTTLLDILFDIEFISGTSLGDRCTPFRGQTVPAHSVLNLTDRQIVAGSRTFDSQHLKPQVTPLTVNGYGAPLGPNGQGQLVPANTPAPLQGSYRGAATALPINGHRGSGSARGRRGPGQIAAQGSRQIQQQMPLHTRAPASHLGPNGLAGRRQPHNAAVRGRGHGGTLPSNQHSTSTNGRENIDDGIVKHNPAFRPQSYNNEPPPASLDARGRARGRGGIRGEAGRGRGRGGRAGHRGVTHAQTPAPITVQQQS